MLVYEVYFHLGALRINGLRGKRGNRTFGHYAVRLVQAIFKNKSRKSLSETFAVHCAKLGATIVEESETRVKCDENISEGVKSWGRAFLGTGHSSDIHAYIQFNLIKRGVDTHVQVLNWVQLQMPGGQIRRKDYNTPYYNNDAQAYLYIIGGQPV